MFFLTGRPVCIPSGVEARGDHRVEIHITGGTHRHFPARPGADGVVQDGGAGGRSRLLGSYAGYPEVSIVLGTRLQLLQGTGANLH
jgi:hypothetical protein